MDKNKKLDINYLIDFSEALEKDLKTPLGIAIHENKTMPSDFKILKNIAKGGYGEVYVVQKDGRIYAMKKVSKELVLKNPNTTFFMNEKEIMTSHSAEWLVKSHMCVQDDEYIYYIMDFISGGDLLGYLSKIDIMKENEIRFYAAELFLAVNEIHKLGWIHRDLKPDNILIDKLGHVKIADFGSCAKLVNGYVMSSTTVGTPDYVSPDVLSSIGETVVYGTEVDYWTVGVILYEMFYGATPFYADSLRKTYDKINGIKFQFEDGISEDLRDLISNLLCLKEKRYNFEKVKSHSFFSGIDWDNIRSQEAPFKPRVESEGDISNFVDTEFEPDNSAASCGYKSFIGFTYDPEHCQRISKSFFYENLVDSASSERCQRRSDLEVSHMLGSVNLNKIEEKDKISLKEVEIKKNELLGQISKKEQELAEITSKIHDLNSNFKAEKLEKETLIERYNTNLKNVVNQILSKNEMLEGLQASILDTKEELSQAKSDITESLSPNAKSRILEDVRDIKKTMERYKFAEKLDLIQADVYWLYKQNVNLADEVKSMAQKDSDNLKNKSTEHLKKQLRMQKSEIREFEQKIEQEIIVRKKLEDEIKNLKKILRDTSRMVNDFTMQCINASNNKDCVLTIENSLFKLDGHECLANSVYIRDLKNNEMHHLSHKKRALCIQVHFLEEEIRCSSSSGIRRSLKALESDIEKELKIIKGLDDLLKVLDGKTKEEAEMQKKGSLRKIEQLKAEVERAKKSTISENVIDDNEKVNEFNNHLFYEKTVAKGTLCDHCNEVLYGIVNQALVCKDCLLVVHKSCYVLVEESCELNRAMKSGTMIPVICKTKEDKEKLLKINKSLF